MSGGTTVKTSTTEPWAEQKPYLQKGMAQADTLLKAGLPDYYSGQTLAGFTPGQQDAMSGMAGYITGPRAARQQAGAEGALARSLGGYTGFNQGQTADLLAGKVDLGATSPFATTANALQQQVMGQLKGNILPGLRQQTMTYQPGGGSRGNLVQNKAISNAVTQGLTKPLADMYSGAYQQAQGMRLPAAGMGIQQQQFGQGQYPTTMAAPLGMYSKLGEVGAQQQRMDQAIIDRDMAKYQYDTMSPYNALNQYMNTIAGNYGGTTTQTTPKDNSGMMNMIGSLGSAMIMASDARVKENLVRDGTIDGHPAYKFNYIGDSTPRRGVIAQEVEKTNPEAVAEFGGIKHVNYELL